MAAEMESLLHHHVGGGESGLDAAGIQLPAKAHVVAELGMDDLLAAQRLLHVDHHRQLLPFGFDELRRVLGLGARLGDHRRHRFALPACALDGDRVLRRRLDALEVRQHRDPRLAVLGYGRPIEHCYHARGFYRIIKH
jgi:hypothetical protein